MARNDEAIGYPVYYELPPVLVVRRASNPFKIAITVAICLFLLSLAAFLLWPKVHVQVRKTELINLSWDTSWDKINSANGLGIDLKFKLQVRVKNPNLFGVRYDRIVVKLSYRGDELGRVVLEGGHIPPLSSVDLDALMDLRGIKVLNHAVRLLLDINMGRLPLETDTEFSGNVEFLFLRPYIHTKVNCDTLLNPKTNEVLDQSCLLSAN